jgi:hypothetical protein
MSRDQVRVLARIYELRGITPCKLDALCPKWAYLSEDLLVETLESYLKLLEEGVL